MATRKRTQRVYRRMPSDQRKQLLVHQFLSRARVPRSTVQHCPPGLLRFILAQAGIRSKEITGVVSLFIHGDGVCTPE